MGDSDILYSYSESEIDSFMEEAIKLVKIAGDMIQSAIGKTKPISQVSLKGIRHFLGEQFQISDISRLEFLR